MKKAAICLLGMALASLVGCSRGTPPAEAKGSEEAPSSKTPVAVNVPDDVDFAQLLTKPRVELAALAVDVEEKIERQQQLRQEGKLQFTLLPEARLPLVVPVFRKASYVETRGVSLPPYVKEEARDSAVALHLARHGDLEAAIGLLERDDVTGADRLREASLPTNYPVEWTRLVALHLHASQISLAADNPDGAAQLVSFHRQLRKLLDEKAKQSPLGQALLSRGLGTLKQARAAWKGTAPAVAKQVDEFLASLHSEPCWSLCVPVDGAALARSFGAKEGQEAIVATSPSRALDLLCLPVPQEAADTCVGFLDDKNKVSEVLVLYRPVLFDFSRPEQFAFALEEQIASRRDDLASQCVRLVWDVPQARLQVLLTPQHAALGGVLSIQPSPTSKTAKLTRNFGPVDLDRTFDANRRIASWGSRGQRVTLSPAALKDLANPLTSSDVAEATLSRHAAEDLVDRLTFLYTPHKGDNRSLGALAVPLFLAAGQPKFAFGDLGSQIDLIWTDGTTQYRLRFPYGKEKPLSLDVANVSTDASSARLKEAMEKDQFDRKVRIEGHKALSLVPRQIEGWKLGMSKGDFVKALPGSAHLLQRDIPGGVMAAFLGAPSPGDAVAREWFARFDKDALVELRVRYTDIPANKPGTFAKKLEAWKKQLGQPETQPSSSSWFTDLPGKGTSVLNSWQDDRTILKCRQEPFGLEVTLRDCPPEHANGLPLPPLEYLGTGPRSVRLGMAKEELERLGAKSADGAFVLSLDAKAPFDAAIAWVENGKVARVVARHRAAAPMKSETEASKLLLQEWAKDARSVGWPLRQDQSGTTLQSLASHDDQTRYRLFWRNEGHGVNLFSEWKDLR